MYNVHTIYIYYVCRNKKCCIVLNVIASHWYRLTDYSCRLYSRRGGRNRQLCHEWSPTANDLINNCDTSSRYHYSYNMINDYLTTPSSNLNTFLIINLYKLKPGKGSQGGRCTPCTPRGHAYGVQHNFFNDKGISQNYFFFVNTNLCKILINYNSQIKSCFCIKLLACCIRY